MYKQKVPTRTKHKCLNESCADAADLTPVFNTHSLRSLHEISESKNKRNKHETERNCKR